MTKMEANMLFVMKLLESRNGVITVAELQEMGVTRKAIYELEKYEYLEKVDLGVYRRKGQEEDVLYETQKQFPTGIYSLDTALYIHGLSDILPEKLGITYYAHSHAPPIAERTLHVRYTDKYDEGIVEASSKYGNPLKVYSKERTLAEICRGSYKIDEAIIRHAYSEYAKLPEKDAVKIYEYSTMFLGARSTVNYIREYMPEEYQKVSEIIKAKKAAK